MTIFLHLFATIAFVLPGIPADEDVFARLGAGADNSDVWAAAADPAGSLLLVSKQPGSPGASGGLAGPLAEDSWSQVRIEQRVMIRVTPRAPGRDAVVPQVEKLQTTIQPVVQPINPALHPPTVRVRERKTGNCMPASGIAAVQPITDGRLMFYMRDRRMLAAGLEKACSARDFYLGFYMSKTNDGQLCVGRDPIHSRAGTTCKIKDVREYVPVE